MITGAEREHRGELGPLGGEWGVFVTPLEEEELLVIICPGWHNNSVPGLLPLLVHAGASPKPLSCPSMRAKNRQTYVTLMKKEERKDQECAGKESRMTCRHLLLCWSLLSLYGVESDQSPW